MRWRGEGGQHQGARPYQEDSWALRALADGALLAVVADGMGGHAGGAVASRLVVETFVRAVEAGASLSDALQQANLAVRERAAGRPDLAGMGCTLVAARLRDDDVTWISVGDSPLYLALPGKVERLNADHSMAPQIDALVGQGVMTAAQAANHPGRHTLREAVMGQPLSLIDEGSRRVGEGARLLVCSDGVQSLPDAEIATLAERSVDVLIKAVLAVGNPHQDNVTVIRVEREA
jgi:serine/threonine protein phosphatase PrpC